MSLPSSQAFITNLFNTLSTFHSNSETPVHQPAATPQRPGLNPTLPSNPLLEDPSQTASLKPLLTTLHLLFPNELLPALDLLDRGLVSKLILQTSGTDTGTGTDELQELAPLDLTARSASQPSFYIVRSSAAGGRNQQFSPRRGEASEARFQTSSARATSYEVRLGAWNCSCPAFAFEAVGGMGGSEIWQQPSDRGRREDGVVELAGRDRGLGMRWKYGGLRIERGSDGVESKVPVCKHLLACLLVEHCPLLADRAVLKVVSENEMAGWSAGWGD